MKKILPALIVAVAAAAGGFTLYRFVAPTAPDPQSGADLAPELVLETLDGGITRLSALRGKLVLINFWATWCAPCLQEIPLLVRMQDRYAARGLAVLGPALDEPAQIRAMQMRLRIQYPILIGEAQIPLAMDALGDDLGALPFSVLISPDGHVLRRKHGEFESDELIQLIEAHLPAG